jgi:hypothetical protein
MAGNNILPIILVGGAAYLAWNWWQSQPAALSVVAAGGAVPPPVSPAPVVPAVAYVPPTTAQALQAAAGAGVTQLNADQWQFYWDQLGKTPIPATVFTTHFFPTGRPPDASQNPLMTAAQFVSSLSGAGLSGYRRGMGFVIPVPIVRGRGGVGYTMADFRRAGRR